MEPADRYQFLEPLLRGMTHEIRNPVQGILASSEALRCRFEEDPASVKLLEMIQRECLRVEQLLVDLLDLARPVELHASPQSVSAVLEESIRITQQQQPGTEIKAEIPAGLPFVYVDTSSMRRALLAVLKNAVESKSSRAIRVTAENLGDRIQVRIQDSGEGILAEDMEHVLEPFFSTRPKKAGLGLTIADRIVRLHQGEFQIESQRGDGTGIIIRLPIRS
ncbi:ATP-binding protein [bacterium]|nr:ATP-binding protein [bacterium]MCI0601637.1 ATP-binding protein [bacterium]